VNLGGPKPKALFAALLLEPGHVVSIERLIDLIWDEQPPATAVALVHTYVSALRRGFVSIGEESVLATRAPGYVLEIDPADVDLVVFARLVTEARQAEHELDHAAAAEKYRQALGLWRGPAFAEVDARFARTRASALHDERLVVEERLCWCELSIGDVATALARLTKLSSTHPAREAARGLLMRALYLSGRQEDALAVYREGRDYLIDELGIEPGIALREVHAQILSGTLAIPAQQAPRVATLPARHTATGPAPNQLPPDIPDFTGRAEQIAQVVGFARSTSASPVVVVSGVGGAGKSALAVHCAHLLAREYPDGQLFIDLNGAGKPIDSADVLARFLRALDVDSAELPDDADGRAALFRMEVAGRRLIIVLDNVRGERQVRGLLPGSGPCLVIITSRSRLTGLAGVGAVELDLLSEQTSVEMLRRIIGEARVANETAAAATIAQLCAGIPLAIRVAGAKLLARAHWPLRTLAARLSDERRRLNELAVGDLAVRSSLELSYGELDDRHRQAFHLLTTLKLPDFGSWLAAPLLEVSLDDAEDVVEHLVDLRLLDIAGVDELGRVRYRFHDLVQLFGAEQAEHDDQDVPAAIGRALQVWMALVELSAARLPLVTLGLRRPLLHTAIEVDPLLVEQATENPAGWLSSETMTVVRAVERAQELGVEEPSITLITSLLSTPFAIRSEFDGWQRTHEVALRAAVKSGNRQAEAALRAGLGQLFYARNDFATAIGHFRDALSTAVSIGTEAIQAVALVGIGTVQCDWAQFHEARTTLSGAAEVAERIGDRGVLAAATYGSGAILRDRGELDGATDTFQRCLELYREIGDRRGEALALRGLGLCRRATGDASGAAALSQQACRILDEVGDFLGAAYARQSLAKAWLRQGRVACVADLLRCCTDVCAGHHDRFGTALMTRTRGELALVEGELARADELLTDALRQWRELDLSLWEARTLRDLAAATALHDSSVAEAHWTRAMDLFAAVGSREMAELAGLSPRGWLDQVRL
jgi:DNA-binding SARP family transcriptional activator